MGNYILSSLNISGVKNVSIEDGTKTRDFSACLLADIGKQYRNSSHLIYTRNLSNHRYENLPNN